EVFYVLDGRISLFLPGEQIQLEAGESMRAPRRVPHTYRVESTTARWLVFCEPAGFDIFVRSVSEGAASGELPPGGREHDLAAIAAAAAAQGIELLGPPGAIPEPR